MWKGLLLESVYFLETSTLGKIKYIKRKESILLTGKTSAFHEQTDCLGQDFSMASEWYGFMKRDIFPVF